MQPNMYHDHAEAIITASQAEVFAYLDDQTRLAAHMEKRSMMMLGGRMTYEFDAAQGRAVGSVIRMRGSFLGISLFVEELVTERISPIRKRWETSGPQRMLVIGSYVMGFETLPVGKGCSVRVFIDYQLPHTIPGRWLGLLFAPFYARWCVARMVKDASRHFGSAAEPGVAA